jgi:predicted enzyme related to lactoylglutathione lyase
MPTMTQHAPGTFCWPECMTTDPAGAKAFYGALFGWTWRDNPMPSGEPYTTLELDGRAVGALQKLFPEMLAGGVPPHWEVYVAVESADQAAAKTKELGGTVIMEPFDVMEHGRMAVLKDPIGGVFCAWQARQHAGVGVLGEPGALAWTQLNATAPALAIPFYTGLFGWAHRNDRMPQGGEYTTFMRGQTPVGGMMPMPPGAGAHAPTHWLNYFATADVDATAAKAASLGGKTYVPPTDIPGMGRFAVLADPQGAAFAIVRFLTP